MRVTEFSFKNRFLLISLIAFAIIGTIVYTFTYYQLKNFILDQTKTSFQNIVENDATKNFNLELPLSLKLNSHINDFINSVKNDTSATDLKFFDSNGTVLYSFNPSEVGQDFSDQKGIKQAIDGSAVAQNIDLKGLTMTEIVPVKSQTGEIRGILAAKVALPSNINQISIFVLELDAVLGIVTLIFIGSIYYVFASAEADLNERDHSLVDQSKAFEEEKQLDDAIMASMGEALIVVNKDGQIMLFNPETEALTGYKSSDVEFRLYRKVLVFYDKDAKETAQNPIATSLKTGQSVNTSIKDGYYLKNSKGELTPVVVSVAPILNPEKKIQGVVVTIQDISAEVELNKVKDEFVYVVAHELGNPIFALDGYLGMLEDNKKKFDKSDQDIVDSARSINRQLSELVNDLLEVVRNEQGTLTCELSKIDLSAIIEAVVKNAQFKAKSKKIVLSWENKKMPKVIGNEQKIKEVVTNLVDNAIKYTPAGGKVEINQSVKDDDVITAVQDTGFGISKKDQENLFQKFYRVKTSQTSDISGTGLGLFICKQIVEKCGGKIWAQSEEGKGSTFTFSLHKAKK